VYITLEDTGLNSGAKRYYLIWVHTLVRLFTKEIAHCVDNRWHTSLTTNENDFVDFLFLEARGFKGTFRDLN